MSFRGWMLCGVLSTVGCGNAPVEGVDATAGDVDARAPDAVAFDAYRPSCGNAPVELAVTGTTPFGPVELAVGFAGKHYPKGGIEAVNLAVVAEETLHAIPFGGADWPEDYIFVSAPFELGTHPVSIVVSVAGQLGTTDGEIEITVLEEPGAGVNPMVVGSLASGGEYALSGEFSAAYCGFLDTFGV